MLNKLTVGTAQFGLPYGISQHDRQSNDQEITKILRLCRELNIRSLDTAVAYGNSELVLGQLGIQDFEISTKLPAYTPQDGNVEKWVENQVLGSISRLGVAKLKCLLLHRPLQLIENIGHQIFGAMVEIRDRGLTDQIGISVYSPEELELICNRFRIDVVQLPFNVIDRRFEQTGWFDRLFDSKIEVHVRSVFLQGLLLMGPELRPKKFHPWNGLWQNWQNWLSDSQQNAIEACLGFVGSCEQISRIVIGIHDEMQLSDVVAALQGLCQRIPPDLSSQELSLIDPSRWSTL